MNQERPLTDDEVIAIVTEDIQKSFGGREYSDIQKKVLKELIELYGQKNFRRIAKRLIQEGTSKPYPIHFKTQLQNLPANEKPRASFAETPGPHLCPGCYNTGKVFIKRTFVEHNKKPVLALCYCPDGMREDANALGLPRFDLSQWGAVDVFPVDFFRDKRLPVRPNDYPGSNSFADFYDDNKHIIENWKNLIKNSQDYWAQRSKP